MGSGKNAWSAKYRAFGAAVREARAHRAQQRVVVETCETGYAAHGSLQLRK